MRLVALKFYLDESLTAIEKLTSNHPIDGIFGTKDQSSSDTVIQYFQLKGDKIVSDGDIIGLVIIVDSPESMEKWLNFEFDKNYKLILVKTTDWHIIPLENLIAKFSKLDSKLIAEASSPEEINLLRNVLELGVDGCLLKPSSNYTVDELLEFINPDTSLIKLQELPIVSIERIGNGDRVCVDTVSNLSKGEGMLVGSTSAVQILVQAEVEESGFVNARPFRINAGVVASYALNFDKTNYLSELSAGSSVMITNKEGKKRKEFLARVKIERRPLIVLKVEYESKAYPVVLQDAETVKILSKDRSIGVNEVKIGDCVLAHISDKARHFGMEIDEYIEEK